MERFCRECGTPLAGRSDKLFCSDDCRTLFHNRRYDAARVPTGEVNRILRYNRSLLERLCEPGVSSLRLSDERLLGFNIRYFTSVERRGLRPSEYGCYEFSYRLAHGRMYAIKKAGS